MIPIVLVPGMLCTPEIFASQITALWPYGSVTVASTLEGDTIDAMAAAILAAAPPRFALAGISMGGYIELEIMRQAPERVLKLALLDTEARPDTPAQTAQRQTLLAQVNTSNFETLLALALPAIVHPAHQDDPALREVNVRMGLAVGIERWARGRSRRSSHASTIVPAFRPSPFPRSSLSATATRSPRRTDRKRSRQPFQAPGS